MKRFPHAVVTPYFREPAEVLERCVASVEGQTLRADHFVVADGHPQDWLAARTRHFALDSSHGDYGGAARGVGALLAAADQYETISFLDADNWFELDHIETCMAAAAAVPECDYVAALSRPVRPDGRPLMLTPVETVDQHVDTNCFTLLRGAFHVLPVWALMPKEPTSVGDRFFYGALKRQNLVRAVTDHVTVNYQTLWESDYRRAGEEPPPNMKKSIPGVSMADWRRSLSPRERVIVSRLMQYPV